MEGIGGNRVGWAELPESVRAAVEDGLGSPVVRAVSCAGGFSPGLASRLGLADGRSVFAKAVSAGYFVHSSLLPPPPGLPTLRAFQAAQAGPALRWLRHLLG